MIVSQQNWFSRYSTNPADYERMATSRPDFCLGMARIASVGRELIDRQDRPVRCLDVGSGPAPAMQQFHGVSGITRRTAIDLDENLLNVARAKCPGLETIRDDMVAVLLDEASFELILFTFAFHHVEDERKDCMCARLREWIAPRGDLLVLDICLEGEEQVRSYYGALLAGLPDDLDSSFAREYMERVAEADCRRREEWKVGPHCLLGHFLRAGWQCERQEAIWPETAASSGAGTFLFHFRVQG